MESPTIERKPLTAKKGDAKKVDLSKKGDAKKIDAKSLSQPFEPFMAQWKPKAESFDVALDRFFDTAGIEAADSREATLEKLLSAMRKQELPALAEELLLERYQRDRVHKLFSILSMRPKTTVRLNFLRADLVGFSESQVAKDLKIKRSSLSPWSFDVAKPELLSSHPSYGKGLYEIHEESSQLIALLSNARPGQRILALNAGSGEAALTMATMMKNTGSLFVYESDPKNIRRFKEMAERAPIDNFRLLSDNQIGEVKSLDTCVIQAPSTGLGLLAHHPELKWKLSKEESSRLQKLQAALLREAGRKLKLGGYIIYASHTLDKSENENQIDHFIRGSHSSFRLVSMSTHLKDFVIPYMTNHFQFSWDDKTYLSLIENDPFLLLSPDVQGTAGLFVSVLQRIRISS